MYDVITYSADNYKYCENYMELYIYIDNKKLYNVQCEYLLNLPPNLKHAVE